MGRDQVQDHKDTSPLACRFFLRRTRNSTTLVGGQVLADLCHDGRDRMWTGKLILVPEARLVMPAVPSYDGGTMGLTLDQVLTSHHFVDPGLPPWETDR